jgi:ferrochelatase
MQKLRNAEVDKLIILPLYPQYSDTTTASSFDRVNNALTDWLTKPEVTYLQEYSSEPYYIDALKASILTAWEKAPAKHLLISFHGIPERYVRDGDPYQQHCEQTANLLAESLGLTQDQWTLCYQSQFGYDKWLKPSTQTLFTELPKKGIKEVDIICPGFALDCLETLEEIALQGQKIFYLAGGQSLRYIPALNDSKDHVQLLSQLVVALS